MVLCFQVLEVTLPTCRDPMRLLQLRNPHGHGEWQGTFSKADLKLRWRDVIKLINIDKLQQPMEFTDNGTFFISFDDFVK